MKSVFIVARQLFYQSAGMQLQVREDNPVVIVFDAESTAVEFCQRNATRWQANNPEWTIKESRGISNEILFKCSLLSYTGQCMANYFVIRQGIMV